MAFSREEFQANAINIPINVNMLLLNFENTFGSRIALNVCGAPSFLRCKLKVSRHITVLTAAVDSAKGPRTHPAADRLLGLTGSLSVSLYNFIDLDKAVEQTGLLQCALNTTVFLSWSFSGRGAATPLQGWAREQNEVLFSTKLYVY